MSNSPTRNDHRDLLLARALGLSVDQIRQVPEYIREFGLALLLDGEAER